MLHRPLLALGGLALFLGACGGGGNEPAQQAEQAGKASALASPSAASRDTSLEAAVARRVVAERGAEANARYQAVPQPVVEPHRRSADGGWAFGGAYFPIPATVDDASPVTALFIARRMADGWEVALEGSERFVALMKDAPAELLGPTERKVFTARREAARRALQEPRLAVDVGLGMPFQLNGSVWGTAGVHGDSGSSRPYNAIDFWGGDGRVLASRTGVAYKFCTSARWPYIELVHDNGWTTGYYHTRNQAAISNGQSVAEGQFIGMTGVELPCGGSASGNHVHWTLWRGNQNGSAEAVDQKLIGGWVWHEGSQPYSGYAERNGVRVYAGQSGLVNYGHGDTPPPTDPCTGTGCTKYEGSFTSTSGPNFHPGSSGFSYGGGTLKAWLKGPSNADFDLILGKYNSSTGQWDRVAGSDGPTSEESLTYSAGAGTYRWRINRYSGSGSYTLWTQQ